MPKAHAKPFTLDRVACVVNYDAVPRIASLRGRMPIPGSPRGNDRPVYARLTLQQLEELEYQIHLCILAIKDGPTTDA